MTPITALDVRAVNPPLKVPHATASGMVASYPMVLLDLRTDAEPSERPGIGIEWNEAAIERHRIPGA